MDIVAVTVWDEEEVSILDGEKLKPVICGFVVSDDVSSVVLVGQLVVVEDPKSLSFPENPHPEKYIKMGSKKTNNFDLANIRTPFQIQ
jgi:hypothetical protein